MLSVNSYYMQKETVTYLKITFLLCIIYNKTNAKLL